MQNRKLTPNVTHGIASTYVSYGCRCEPCTAANSVRVRRNGWRRRANRDENGVSLNPVIHGKATTYVNHHCRCEPCTKANTETLAKWRKARGA